MRRIYYVLGSRGSQDIRSVGDWEHLQWFRIQHYDAMEVCLIIPPLTYSYYEESKYGFLIIMDVITSAVHLTNSTKVTGCAFASIH